MFAVFVASILTIRIASGPDSSVGCAAGNGCSPILTTSAGGFRGVPSAFAALSIYVAPWAFLSTGL